MVKSPALCLVFFVALSAVAQSRATYSPSAAERYIKNSEAALAESAVTNDSSVVERDMADDCVWVMDGKVLSKSDAMADTKQPSEFLSNHLDYAHVRFFGDTAIAQGSESWVRKDGRKGQFIWTDTWLRRNGRWQIVAAQDTSVPATK